MEKLNEVMGLILMTDGASLNDSDTVQPPVYVPVI